ncbi:MAG: hypothetical protein AAFX93_19795 [Verrucomicrobiota bacterium]
MPTETMKNGVAIADELNSDQSLCREVGLYLDADAFEIIAEKQGVEDKVLDLDDIIAEVNELDLDQQQRVVESVPLSAIGNAMTEWDFRNDIFSLIFDDHVEEFCDSGTLGELRKLVGLEVIRTAVLRNIELDADFRGEVIDYLVGLGEVKRNDA